jgi:hypothetical protein
MEYDKVTLLNDFINEEKLLRYIVLAGGKDMNEKPKNKLRIPAVTNNTAGIQLFIIVYWKS